MKNIQLLQLNQGGASILAREGMATMEIVSIKLPSPHLFTSKKIPIEEALQLELYLGAGQHFFFFEKKNLRLIDDSFDIRGDIPDKSITKFLLRLMMGSEIFLPEFLLSLFIKYYSGKENSVLIGKTEPDIKDKQFLFTGRK